MLTVNINGNVCVGNGQRQPNHPWRPREVTMNYIADVPHRRRGRYRVVYFAVGGAACLDLCQTAASIVTASMVAVRCLVDVTSLNVLEPELYLCQHRYHMLV